MLDFMDAMMFRHACKRFAERTIPEGAFDTVLKYGRLSPSSFGLEPWRFLVITDPAWKAKLKPLCWDQKQITQCSHLLVITADNESVLPGSEYVRAMFERRDLPPEGVERYMELYREHMTPQFHSREAVEAWTHKQCYLAAANMMTGAAAHGIDSCPIEGFEKEKLEALLALEPSHSVALIIAFGYRLNPQIERKRLPFEEIVTLIEAPAEDASASRPE